MKLNAVDFGIIAIVVLLCLRGGWRGLIQELASFVTAILSLMCTVIFFGALMPVLFKYFSKVSIMGIKLIPDGASYSPFVNILTMSIIFGISCLIFKWLFSILPRMIEGSILDTPNHVLGACVGFVESMFFIFAVIFIFRLQNAFPIDEFLEKSVLFKWYQPFYNMIQSSGNALHMITDPVRQMFGAEVRRY